MGIFSRLFKGSKAKRRFEAAKFNRLTHSFLQAERSINTELRGDLDALRRRARHLAKNEPMARKYLGMVCANVVGTNGFMLQCRSLMPSGQQDGLANTAIETAWYDWSRAINCDVSAKMSFPDFCRAVMRGVARDGEAIVRIRLDAENAYGYALQFLDIERLDTTLNREASGAKNAISMGVEINADTRPVAYHIITQFPVMGDISSKKTARIPAEEIIHLFVTDDPEQVRGIPWMHASMIRMHHLGGYEEAAIIAARVGAAKMGFFTTPDGDATPLSDGEDEDQVPFTEADPGQFGVLPEGVHFEKFDPDYPHAMYDTFTKAAKRDIGSGLNVSYHSLANDLEGVNFSSIRSGTLEERDEWMMVQGWFISQFLEPVYEGWLRSALLKGAIAMPNGSALPAAKLQKFMAHEFMGRRWSWVDPMKDVQSSVLGMDKGVASPYKIAAQQGQDAEDILDDIARFQKAAREKGVILASSTPVVEEDKTEQKPKGEVNG
jgi:lambda family phage portal protein